MSFKKSKIIVSLLLALALFTGSCLSASADISSEWRYYNGYNNFHYQYRSILGVYSSSVSATAHIQTTDGCPMPSGWVGVDAFLFKQNGVLEKSSYMQYFSFASNSYKVDTYSQNSGVYYAQSIFSLVTNYSNGSYTYTLFPSAETARQSFYNNSTTTPSECYSVNSNGETYGSGMLADICGEYPDLLAAEGINGTTGYVRFDDLVYIPTSPEDAVSYTESIADNENNTIPVYDLDGNIIDTFELSASTDDGELVPADPTPIEPIVH